MTEMEICAEFGRMSLFWGKKLDSSFWVSNIKILPVR
mgnify:FL=1